MAKTFLSLRGSDLHYVWCSCCVCTSLKQLLRHFFFFFRFTCAFGSIFLYLFLFLRIYVGDGTLLDALYLDILQDSLPHGLKSDTRGPEDSETMAVETKYGSFR